MKRILRQLWVTLLFLAIVLTGRSQSDGSVTIGKEDTLFSRLLGESRSFFISLPASYEKDDFYAQKRYPVLILLDADTHFRYAASMIQYLGAGENEQIPELIVVGVRNTNRTRDMTAMLPDQPKRFLQFLEQELMPHLDHRYRTLPYRVLAGHSLAGLFTLTSLLNQSSFNAYIAIDPTLTWNKGYLVQKADSLLRKKPFEATRLYLSQANNPFDSGQHTGERGRAFDTFQSSLARSQPKRLLYRFTYYAQETHFSVSFRSLYDGLLFVFEGYAFPFQVFLEQGSQGVSRHYQQLFTQLGVNLLPPGKVINQAGLFLLQPPDQLDKGIDLLRLNTLLYPTSPMVYRSLGRAYQAKGDTSQAIENYKKVVALTTTDEPSRKALEVLTRKP